MANRAPLRAFYCLALKTNEEEIRRRWEKKWGILAKNINPRIELTPHTTRACATTGCYARLHVKREIRPRHASTVPHIGLGIGIGKHITVCGVPSLPLHSVIPRVLLQRGGGAVCRRRWGERRNMGREPPYSVVLSFRVV